MSKKTDLVAKLIAKIPCRGPTPTPLEGASLVEQGLYAVLQRRIDAKQAERVVEALRKAYVDWNELRVAQAQEISQHFRLGAQGRAVAEDVRSYLQEVFQRGHGLDLEFLRDDPEVTKRFASILPFIGSGTLHYLMWLASDGSLPITAAMMRVLDRVGVATRVTNVKKARAALAPLIPKGQALEFSVRIGEVAARWCQAQSPLCHECPIVDDCRYGKKAFREWKAAQERMELQRQREEARTAVLRKKDEARRAREAARQRKQAALDQRAREREAKRKAKLLAVKKAAEEKRLDAQRAREAAKRKREEERAAKRAQVEARKKAAALKRVADQKAREQARKKAAAERKQAAKKKASAKKSPSKQKSGAKNVAKKTARKKPAGKKSAGRKRPTRKAPAARARKA